MSVGDDAVEEIDRAELVRPLAGTDWWRTGSGAGVPPIKVTDGPAGARGELFAGGPRSACFPCGAALGATWDTGLVERVGSALGREARAKGAHVLLAPTVNLQRTPLGGRHFECFSEDPVLTGVLASAYVTGLQSEGIGACVKHLVANDAEHDRFEVSSEVDERTLRELYLLPFEYTLRGAGSWSVMAAYNRLNGERCTESARLLETILRDEWGWDGVVISDWFATRSAAPSANAGLDIEMPGPPLHFGAALVEEMRLGHVAHEKVADKVARVGLLAQRTGANWRPPGDDGPGGDSDAADVAVEAARQSLVLLRNEVVDTRPVLPFEPDAAGYIALIGPNADREVIQGGGSARVTPHEVITVLDGFREVFGPDGVRYERGCRNDRGTPSIDGRCIRRADGSAGADIEVRDAEGVVRLRLAPRELRAVFLAEPWPGAGSEWSMAATCTYLPDTDGEHRFAVRTNLDAHIVVDGHDGELHSLRAGQPVEIQIHALPSGETAFRAALEVRCETPQADTSIDRATLLATNSSAAVVVVGLDHEWETEGRDREDLALPGLQVELIEAIARVQPRTVVVVIAGAPVDMSWTADVPGVMWAFYPGQGGGRAIAEVIAGLAEPGGRLPCTLPVRLEDTPAYLDLPADPGCIRYSERLHIGHRWYDARLTEPAYPFGFGLSYTSFDISAPTAEVAAIEPGRDLTVSVTVLNQGDRPGTAVVQVYLGARPGPARHPQGSLRAFAKVALLPGEEKPVTFTLRPRDLAWWDDQASTWRADAGIYQIIVARSSRHPTGTIEIELLQPWTAPASSWD